MLRGLLPMAAVVLIASSITIACAGRNAGGTAPTPAETPHTGNVSGVPPPHSAPPAPTRCDATKAQFAISQPASDRLLERARVAADAATARFLRPNQKVTLEFLASRLNLTLNERDVVTSVGCF